MSVKEIEAANAQLPVRDVAELMSWLAEHHVEVWDKQIEHDLDSGKLDALLAEVDKEYEAEMAIIPSGKSQIMAEEIPTHEDVKELVAYLPLFDKPGRQFIKRWAGGEKLRERSFNVSYPVYEEDVKDFFRLASQPCWNKSSYDPGIAGQMLDDEQGVSQADIDGIRMMLTFCVRGERFCDGHWEDVLQSGKVVALLRRLRQIQEASSGAVSPDEQMAEGAHVVRPE